MPRLPERSPPRGRETDALFQSGGRLIPHHSLKRIDTDTDGDDSGYYELEVHLPGYIMKQIHLEVAQQVPYGGKQPLPSIRISGERRCRRDRNVVLSSFNKTYEFDHDADLGRARHVLSTGILLVIVPIKKTIGLECTGTSFQEKDPYWKSS
mmetsp:Transcript_27673/g.81341  ORF Transcript_27673/g.81341 Transcript_27673/m.81341 type:complete len:152 (-) Transcript_27673:137-592(-)